jgi:integrase
MARQIERLSARAVQAAKKPGLHPDGAGLYLQVSPSGSKSWVWRYQLDGRRHDIGLGPLHLVSLADAREKAREHGRAKLAGTDPLTEKRALRAFRAISEAKLMTFREAAEKYIEAHSAGWKSTKSIEQWQQSLRDYVYPVLGNLPVQAIDVALVMKIVELLWKEKTETATRVRSRIEAVLDWATVRGYRQGDNPARWKGHLDNLLPARTKAQKVEHHAALPYDQIAEFMIALRQQTSIAARALEFLTLTATRSAEALGARWSEIDMAERLWTIPGERMKAGKEHRVPLSDAALAVLNAMPRIGDYVFPAGRGNGAINNPAVWKLLTIRMNRDCTTHGFRSTFRDWAAERTNFPREVAEIALAHAVGDAVERAYQRGDLFDKRRQLMDAWARFCDMPATAGTGEKVIAIGTR